VGLLIGIGGTVGVNAVMEKDTEKTNTQQVSSTDHSSMSMDDMTKELKDLSGDEFDKAFLSMMIAHHEGAVDMAELLATNGKHAELKELGQDIISAQTKEIAEMKQWQMEWGYVDSGDSMEGMDHSGM
jgi:uncharacterized protein (DUF305 family)